MARCGRILGIFANINIQYVLIFLLSFVISFYLQFASPEIIGPDGYYHIKQAHLLRTEGVSKSFPWMQYSYLGENYNDMHFLYHVFLTPFTYMDLTVGAKLSVVLIFAFVVTVFFWLLKKWKIRMAWLWVVLLLISCPRFLFRLSLPKAQGFSLIFLFMGLYLISRKKYPLLFLLAMAYSLLYTAFPLLLITCIFYSGAEYFRTKNLDWKMLVSCFSGIISGLLIHPYFPNNFKIYFTEIFLSLTMPNHTMMGLEFFPFSSAEFFVNLWMVIVLSMFALYFYATGSKDAKSSTLLLLWLFFLVLTVRARKFAEYWVPFSVLFCALVSSTFLGRISDKVRKIGSRKKVLLFLLIFFLLLLWGVTTLAGARQVVQADHVRGASSSLKPCALWLVDNSRPGEIVYAQWYEFGPLFLHNSQNYYVNGLGSNYLYVYNKTLFEKTLPNEFLQDPAAVLEAFNSRWVVISKYNPGLLNAVISDERFTMEFNSTQGCHVFRLTDRH